MGEYYGVRRTNDPDGEYLQHWGILKGAMREGHKYLARLVTPSGYRYIYNQAELAAAKAGKAVSGAAKSASNAANSAYRAVRKGIGIDARERAQKASARAERMTAANNSRREQSVSANRNARMARGTAKRAQAAYDRTLLGRAEKAFNSGRKAVTSAANEAGRQISGAANDAQRYVNKQVKNAQKTARGVQKKVKAYQDFRNMSEAEKRLAVGAEKLGVKNARGAGDAMKLWNVERSIRNAPKNAAKAISDTANDVSKAATNAYNRAKKGVRETAADFEDAYRLHYKPAIKKAQYNVKMAGEKAVRGLHEANYTVGKAMEGARKQVVRTAKKAGRQIDRTIDQGVKAAEKATGVSARRKTETASRAAESMYQKKAKGSRKNKIMEAAVRAENEYLRTPLGHVENALTGRSKNGTVARTEGLRQEVKKQNAKGRRKKKKKTQLKRTGNVARAQLTRHTGGNF